MSRNYKKAFKQGYRDGFREGFTDAMNDIDSDEYHRANYEGYAEGFEQGSQFATEELVKVLQDLVVQKMISLDQFTTIKKTVSGHFKALKEEELEYTKLKDLEFKV